MLDGKYSTWNRYLAARARRWPILAAIAPLARWKPIASPKDGYSIVVACHARLAPIMIPSLRLLASQDLSRLDRTFVVFDAPRTDDLEAFGRRLAEGLPDLRITCLYQSPAQARVLRIINWGWVDCWLSYCLGLARVETRHAMLHDMDALLLQPGLVEGRYEAMLRGGHSFLGVFWYAMNGLRAEDRAAYIVEMFLDAELIRSRFRPLDLFNRVTMVGDRSADLDILIYPQMATGRSEILPLSEREWVHPSQVVSQFTYLNRSAKYVPPSSNNLWFIPYFLDLAGTSPGVLEEHTRGILASEPDSIPILNRRMDMRQMTPVHLRWVVKNIIRIERATGDGLRPEVARYLDAIQSRCTGAPAGSFIEEVEAELDAEAIQTARGAVP